MIAYQRLKEREKEINCIYSIKELLKDAVDADDTLFTELIKFIPPAWQYPTVCEVKLVCFNKSYQTSEFKESPWILSSDIIVDNNIIGNIIVVYTQMIRMVNNNQFLPDEQKLLNVIALMVGNFLFNKKLEKTIKYLKSDINKLNHTTNEETILPGLSNEHWKWRKKMAMIIAEKLNPEKFGVKAIYLTGSTKNANAGPGSDIDLLIHFNGKNEKLSLLKTWIEGWSLCLSQINFEKTGYQLDSGLIDLHIITDEDIKKKTSYSTILDSFENSALVLREYTY